MTSLNFYADFVWVRNAYGIYFREEGETTEEIGRKEPSLISSGRKVP